MSLMDALLLDEYHDPKDIWATPRVDRLKGSGSATDPYDTGELAGRAMTPSAATFSILDLLCITQANHGYVVGDVVSITDVIGNNAAVFNLITTLTAAMIVSDRALLLPLSTAPTAGINSMVEFKRVQTAQSVMGFQNRTQQGAWVSTWFEPTGKYLEDIVTRIEDVTSVCF